MANKSFTFVEDTDDDNGYDFLCGTVRFGEVDVENVEELVDHIDQNVGENDCIENITIIGHGRPGNISVGDGQGNDDQKRIGLTNENIWGPLLDRLACRFCENGTVYLRGCNVGADSEGAELLHRIKLHLECATVQAPTGVCNAFLTFGEDQESRPDEDEPPETIPNPDKKSKKDKLKKEKEEISKILGGSDSRDAVAFLPNDVTDAVLLLEPGYGQPDLQSKQNRKLKFNEKQIYTLIDGLEKGVPKWYPNHGFDVNAYLQLQVRINKKNEWLPSGAILGNGTYFSAFGNNTMIVWVLNKKTRKMLKNILESYKMI